MDHQRVRKLLRQGEGPKLDYKENINLEYESGKRELVKDIIAIANSQGGRGHLIIGVKDKTREIVGIDPMTLNEERIQQIISQRCDPPINVRVEHVNIDGKFLGVITIFRSHNRPHQMRQTGAFYIRRGSTTDIARRDEVANLLQSNGIISNEQIPIYNIGINVLNKDLIKEYLRKINIPPETEDLALLNNLGIIHYDRDSEQYYPTFGGILLFCENPQQYLPYTGIKLIYFQGDERIELCFNGNLLSLLDNVMEYILSLIEHEDGKFPVESIEEGIANAIVHRDYFDKTREIVVFIGDRYLEISNPGAIVQKDKISHIIHDNNPVRRNNWLYHRLLIIDDKKRFMKTGLGLSKIDNSFKGIGKVKFINNKKENLFKVLMPSPKLRIQ